jgi:molybdopterin-binding protein
MLRVESLHIRTGDFTLDKVSFSVEKGQYFVLLGASGTGKTVLLEALAGLIPMTSGALFWEQEEFTRAPIQARCMGLVYQDQALFPHMTVFRNIAYGIRNRHQSQAKNKALVLSMAETVGATHLLHRRPDTLSGGEAQRVALARALISQPRCLLLDEPLSALDIHARETMRALLRKIHRSGQTIIHVTHDYEEALSLASRIGILEGGAVVQTGAPEYVFQHPQSEFVARFIGIRNIFAGTLERSATRENDTALFSCQGISFDILTQSRPGRGLMLLRSEDVTLSKECPQSSARNCFQGKIMDMVPARLGLEVYVNIGVEVAALVTHASRGQLGLQTGADIWVSFKAGAARFMEE